MRLKAGVVTDGVQPPVWWMLGVADMVYSEFGCELVVTSLRDGTHHEGSLHGLGLAADMRTKDLPDGRDQEIRDELHSKLYSLGYDIVLETAPPHIHGEWDGKRSAAFFGLSHQEVGVPVDLGGGLDSGGGNTSQQQLLFR